MQLHWQLFSTHEQLCSAINCCVVSSEKRGGGRKRCSVLHWGRNLAWKQTDGHKEVLLCMQTAKREKIQQECGGLSRFGLEVAWSTFACVCLAEAARVKLIMYVCLILIFICHGLFVRTAIDWSCSGCTCNSHFMIIVFVCVDYIVGKACSFVGCNSQAVQVWVFV